MIHMRITNSLQLTVTGILFVGLLFGYAGVVQADDPHLAEIQVIPENPAMQVDQSLEFTASGKDQNGDPFPLSDPQWQGDSWHGTISVNPTDPTKCTFTATAAGDSYIICWEGQPRQGPHGSTDITITQGSGQVLGSIVVTPSDVTLNIGESKQFSAAGYDTNGNPISPPITPMWSTSGGTIVQDGTYTAPDTEGDYEVTASVSGSGSTITCTVDVHVPPRPVQAWVDENGVLQIKLQGDANARVGVDKNGNVLVNGQPVGDPPVKAGDIEGINVEGGTGDNIINLEGVTPDDFPNMSTGYPGQGISPVKINAGGGDDIISGSDFNDAIDGGSGDDMIAGNAGDDNMWGGTGNDEMHGNTGSDSMIGGDGNDHMSGDSGGDHMSGGEGSDNMWGGVGEDQMLGGDGHDEMHGGDHDDMMDGGDGNDGMHGGTGNDQMYGWLGVDHMVGDDGNDHMDGGWGDDDMWGGEGNDQMLGGAGNDQMLGGFGNDQMFGDFDDDQMWGGSGNDEMYGGSGNDEVNDEIGDDTYINTPGSADTIIDEAGIDTLDFSPAASGITIDMDLTDVDQVVDAAGNTVRLEGQFENFIGSEFDDVVSLEPLAVPRSIDGGDGTDTLNLDAKGVSVTDDGTTITAEGFAPVTYTNFEAVDITNTSGLGTPVETAMGTAYFTTDAGTLENLLN